MARAVNVDLTLDDFQRISDKTPFLADLKPSGKYVMEDMQRYGGTPAVMRMLLDAGRLSISLFFWYTNSLRTLFLHPLSNTLTLYTLSPHPLSTTHPRTNPYDTHENFSTYTPIHSYPSHTL